jgi:hypothetical protein
MDKKVIMLGMVFGSFIGGWLPTIFGVGAFSLISVLTGFLGGALGIWITFRMVR